MGKRESLYFYTLHKCASSLFGAYALKNITGLVHRDYAVQIYTGSLKGPIAFEETGYAYGPIRASADPAAPVYRLLVEPACRAGFVRDKIALLMVRDPRDILISRYYSFGKSHSISEVDEIAAIQNRRREEIQQSSLDDYVLDAAANTQAHFETMIGLAKACERSSILRYEEMIHDWPAFSTALTKYAAFDDAVLTEIHDRSRPRDTINEGEHRRSGRTEQFRTALKPETVGALNELFRPVLEFFGYAR